MDKLKFAFILMGPQYDPEKHTAHFELESKHTYIYSVRNFEEAEKKAKELLREGFGAIELCGAFGPELTQKIIDATENKIAVGYVTHFPSEDEKFLKFFGKK